MAARAMASTIAPVAVGSLCSAAVYGESGNRVRIGLFTSSHLKPSKRVFSQGLLRTELKESADNRILKNGISFNENRMSQRGSAASGEVPEEVLEDSKFVPLNDDDPRYGPAVLFLVGFGNSEAVGVQEMLQEMDGNFLRIVLCTPEMINGTLGQAVNTLQSDVTTVRVARNLPTICFLSGLTGEEIMLLIQAFRDFGFEDTVFAAHVPKNTDKSLEELIEEIMGDHERLSKSPQHSPS